MITKTCTCCGITKPITDFHERMGRKTKQWYSYCKRCSAGRRRSAREAVRPAPSLPPGPATAENNAFNLWHGPVDRTEPLRWAA